MGTSNGDLVIVSFQRTIPFTCFDDRYFAWTFQTEPVPQSTKSLLEHVASAQRMELYFAQISAKYHGASSYNISLAFKLLLCFFQGTWL